MKSIYYNSSDQESSGVSVFLAGPTDRRNFHTFWRTEAKRLFSKKGFAGSLYFPEFEEEGTKSKEEISSRFSYIDIIEWERKYLKKVSHIMFWIPRDINELIGLTTNCEFGEFYKDERVYAGAPDNALKIRYLKYIFERYWNGINFWRTSLEDLVDDIMQTQK